MNDFLSFLVSCGLIVNFVETGKIVRCKTTDKPHKRNGAYLFDGVSGWCQNWGTMDSPAVFKSDKPFDREAYSKHKQKQRQDEARRHQKAAYRAELILSQCELDLHAYFDSKGFPKMRGMVWRHDETKGPLLIIPMRVDSKISGCQVIDINGNKKFLYGQQSKGAEYVFDNGGTNIWCEGYATALSIQDVLAKMKLRYRIHVCFSASNMAYMADSGIVIADNDESGTGEKAAKKTGLPYFMPPNVGEDFNDYARRENIFIVMNELRKVLQKI